MSMKKWFAAIAVSMCLVAPPVAAQIFSWDPLKDVQEALPQQAHDQGERRQDQIEHDDRQDREDQAAQAAAGGVRGLCHSRRQAHLRIHQRASRLRPDPAPGGGLRGGPRRDLAEARGDAAPALPDRRTPGAGHRERGISLYPEDGEEAEALTGPLIGLPKSASYRLRD